MKSAAFRLQGDLSDSDYKRCVNEYLKVLKEKGTYLVVSNSVNGYHWAYFTRGETHVSKKDLKNILMTWSPSSDVMWIQPHNPEISHENALESVLNYGIWFEVGSKPFMFRKYMLDKEERVIKKKRVDERELRLKREIWDLKEENAFLYDRIGELIDGDPGKITQHLVDYVRSQLNTQLQ